MSQNGSVYGRLSEDQVIFLNALIDLGGEADKSELREEVKSENPHLSAEWDGDKVDYQITRLSDGNSNVEGLGIVEAERQGIDDSGSHLPKLVTLVDEGVKEYVEEFEGEDGFGSYEEAHSKHLDEIEELKTKVGSLEEELLEVKSDLEGERQARKEIVEDFKDAIQTLRDEMNQ